MRLHLLHLTLPLLLSTRLLADLNPAAVAALSRQPAVQAALEAAKRNEAQTIEEQVRLTEIEAPPFAETKRGEVVRRRFEELGLRQVRVDAVGNVIGVRPGRAARPNLVFSAHLDTVFPAGTNVTVRRNGTRLTAPGIGDDGRGLAVLLASIRALQEAKVETPGTITFVATVGEEGLGDLRGVKHLFGESLKGQIDRFVSIDGTGLDMTNVGVGSHRYKVMFKGPGGHSFGSFGSANPIHALGRAIARIADFEVPTEPKTTFNVGRIQGGTSVNSIAYEAWMEVDLRSSDAKSLAAVDRQFQQAVKDAVTAENKRWSERGRISGSAEMVGIRPAGQTPETAPIVESALAVSKALGLYSGLREGSTDSNVPMNLGIPAITISGGGRGQGAHSLDETFDTTDSWKGTQRAVLPAIALAQ